MRRFVLLVIANVFVYLQDVLCIDEAVVVHVAYLTSLSPVQEARSNNSPMIYNPLCIVSLSITCPPSTNKYG